jgi:flagellar hook-associated protein 2
MSDLSIPGVTDTYNTQKIIDALMKVKREPLTRMEGDLATEQQKKTVWQDVNKKVSGLRETARALFGFQNPFNDRVATSSDESILTATATRQAASSHGRCPGTSPLRPASTASASGTKRCPWRGRGGR